jgi:hypothetical protein
MRKEQKVLGKRAHSNWHICLYVLRNYVYMFYNYVICLYVLHKSLTEPGLTHLKIELYEIKYYDKIELYDYL